jgi:endonuclease YncB( thermonuclease family)
MAILAGGRFVAGGGDGATQAPVTENRPAAGEPAVTAARDATPSLSTEGPSSAIEPEPAAPARQPGLERIEPRGPLSELALALPPRPKPGTGSPGEEGGVTLFRPVASAAGVIEGKDRSVAIAGIDAVPLDQICTDERARKWGCGLHARGAFRAFLRGRAVVCDEPLPGGEDAAVACRVGKQDLGQWLVENGWARAAPGGPYVEVQAAAERAKKGIFGAAPDLSGMQPEPEAVGAPGSILDLSGGQAMPPTVQPAPFQ